eukprot:10390884-Karenia_brevis.AAC.1
MDHNRRADPYFPCRQWLPQGCPAPRTWLTSRDVPIFPSIPRTPNVQSKAYERSNEASNKY